jgi:hypothetical protein
MTDTETPTQHTPGPWIVSESERKCLAIFPGNDKDRPRALCSIAWVLSWNDTANDSANARLIAAAPELLAVLKDVQLALLTGASLKADADLQIRIGDTIAKATGLAA